MKRISHTTERGLSRRELIGQAAVAASVLPLAGVLGGRAEGAQNAPAAPAQQGAPGGAAPAATSSAG